MERKTALKEQEKRTRKEVKLLRVKLAGQESDPESQEEGGIQDVEENSGTLNKSSECHREENMIRSEMDKEIPMCVSLPIEVMMTPDQAFPFLNTTLADLGIDE